MATGDASVTSTNLLAHESAVLYTAVSTYGIWLRQTRRKSKGEELHHGR